MHETAQKRFAHAEEVREFPHGTVESLAIGADEGAITSLPRGHDAWVVGDEPVVVVDWYGASSYAKA